MELREYLDSTYLKTPEQAGLSFEENLKVAEGMVQEAIQGRFKLVMIRPDLVRYIKEIISAAKSKVLVGTVIDFPEGRGGLEGKLDEAKKAIEDGADELDFVVDYEAFKAGETEAVKKQVLECTGLCLQNNKTVKWIIEVAALDDHQIVQLTVLIKNVVLNHFNEADYSKIFVKSSTGFYVTQDGKPNGATMAAIKLMIENSFPLPVKAAGGVRTYEEAMQMINMGVKRIGTSSARAIVHGGGAHGNY
jgi:deoxyribose-phosphate aldolase